MNSRYGIFFDMSPDLCLVFDFSGKILSSNKILATDSLFSLIHGEDLNKAHREISNLKLSNTDTALDLTVLIAQEQPRLYHWIWRSSLEEQLIFAMGRAAISSEASHSLASKTRHDLKNALTIIRGYAEILASSTLDETKRSDFSARVVQATARMQSLIENPSASSSGEKATQTPHSIAKHNQAKRGLVIDDDPQVTLLLSHFLQSGFTMESAPDVKTGMQKLVSGQYDFVLTDLNFPDGSSTDIILAARKAGTVVLVMSGNSATDPLVEGALRLGAVDFIRKPFESARVVREIISKALVKSLPSPRKEAA